MAKLCRRVRFGPGAEVLVNQGRRFLNYVEGIPNFLGNPMMDEAVKNAIAKRNLFMADGSVLRTSRGFINRSEAVVSSAKAQSVERIPNEYVALDAYTIQATVLDDGELVATAKTSVGILISRINDLKTWTLVPGVFTTFAAGDVDANPTVPIGEGFVEVVPRNTAARAPVLTGIPPEKYVYTALPGSPPLTEFTEKKWPMVCVAPNCYGTYKWMCGAAELEPENGKVYFATVTQSGDPVAPDTTVVGTLSANNYLEELAGAYVAAGDFGLLGLKATCVISFSAYKAGLDPGPYYGGYYPGAASGASVSYPYTSDHPGDAYSRGLRVAELVVRINGSFITIKTAIPVSGDVRTAYYFSQGDIGEKLLFSRAAYTDNPTYDWNDLDHLVVGVADANGVISSKTFSAAGAVADNFSHSNRLVKIYNSSTLGEIYSYGYARIVRR